MKNDGQLYNFDLKSYNIYMIHFKYILPERRFDQWIQIYGNRIFPNLKKKQLCFMMES